MNAVLSAVLVGLGQGALVAIIALGFVVIYRATGVLNFAQPALLVLGAFATSVFAVDLGVPFAVAVVAAMAVVAALAMGIERVAVRPMVGTSMFSAALVTVGIFIVLLVIAFRLFDSKPRTVGDPWQLSMFCLGGDASTGCSDGVQLYWSTIGRIVIAAIVIAALGWWLTRSRVGLAMRATSDDQEAALAQGVNVGRMFSLAWGIGGALAALGGALLSANGSVIQATDAMYALIALPAIILGGLDSLKGAVIGGLVIGIAVSLTKLVQPQLTPVLGANIDSVVPWALMILVLLIRPYGLFGTKEVERV